MTNATRCPVAPATTDPCNRCDMLLGLGCVRVESVDRSPGRLAVTISTPWRLVGCPDCGVVAPSRGRRARRLHDVPHAGTRVELVWRQRLWRCPESACPRGVFVEQVPDLVAPRGSITTRAISWAISQLRSQHATIAGLAVQLGVAWKTLWRALEPVLARLAEDEARFASAPRW